MLSPMYRPCNQEFAYSFCRPVSSVVGSAIPALLKNCRSGFAELPLAPAVASISQRHAPKKNNDIKNAMPHIPAR